MKLTGMIPWRWFGLLEVVGLALLSSPASASAPHWEALQEAIVAQQTSLGVAICQQQWPSAIDLTTGLIGIPQISAAQRQAYVDLRHILEGLQSRSSLPHFVWDVLDFNQPYFPDPVSSRNCGAIEEKVRLNAAPPLVQQDLPIQWKPVIDRHHDIYHD
ncbi:MAG: hypothetical protein ACO31I_00355 [Prochlorotrichaceae cyanobacterium]|jgi:hypothetical protein